MTTLSLPLSVARDYLIENGKVCTIIRESAQRVEFLMKATDGTAFSSRIEHRLREESMLVSMQHQQKFVAQVEFQSFSFKVDRCIKNVLERGDDTLPGHVVPAYDGRIAVLQYVVLVQYGFLSDKEYTDQLDGAISQCSKAMALMFSIIADLCAAGRAFSEKECMRSVYRGYGCLVPPVSAQQASGRPN